METVLDSIGNGQWSQVIEQMKRYDIEFKDLESEGVRARDIAIIADKWIREMK